MEYVSLQLGDEENEPAPSPSAPPASDSLFAPRPPPGRPSAPSPPHAPRPHGAMGDAVESFEVHVSDPTKQGTGMQAFVSYNVTSKTSLQQYRNPENTVPRRYNHFVWLHAQLTEEFPCCFIPVLPDKSGINPMFNRFQEDFVEGRKIALEQYLGRLARHPVIQSSKPLQTFFEGDESLMRLPEEKKPSFFGGILKELSVAPKVPRVSDEEFDAMRLYVRELEGQLAELHKFLERLVRRRKDLASSLAELGLTLITLAGHEGQSGGEEAGKAFTDLGSCCDHLAISLQQQSNDEAKKALMVVDDWLRVVRGAKEAIKRRGEQGGNTVLLRQEVDRKTKLLATGNGGKQGVTESDVMELSRKVEESARKCETLSERVRSEMEAMKRQKSAELRSMLCGFVRVQVQYGSEVQKSWERVLPSLVAGLDPQALDM
mmetsp:Transcript_5182/g.12009  ORF Transcript_5182/g.12009 Transcript_5182/m.12009 type:complete len:431 (-) Transcript_5182:107-1399(-)|eukprot:CAMPEP_0114147046 /NCGR_PEP_ID=MMETSP0043_2-20121206/20884_1 /TAXON_ID=464988 /ORGANISM="Hemiselmis andersenii, Strain CCMP644" /LENGTH=430 /DNA_ID=CAMNT_0001241531 /DNA_START=256 /DNA_END=1548 /DNA_ORIENTATION=-